MNEQRLWEQFISGDDSAYVAIYNKYADAMYSYGLKFTLDGELVKDCIHDVFVRIYTNRKRLCTTDNVKLYLFTALKNTLYNCFRKDEVFCPLADDPEPTFDVEYSVEDALDALIAEEDEQARANAFNNLINSLTSRQKEAIYYRYVEGMELEDICLLMQMNYQSLQNIIQRSIRKIRIAVEKGEVKFNYKFFYYGT
jgi:RNA polymerase sigma factor (sigma-70 family)